MSALAVEDLKSDGRLTAKLGRLVASANVRFPTIMVDYLPVGLRPKAAVSLAATAFPSATAR